MYSSCRCRGLSATIQIILIFGYTAYVSEAILPLSIHQERQHNFPQGFEVLAPNYHAGDHLKTGITQNEPRGQRHKTVLVNTGQMNVKFSCDSRHILFMNGNRALVPPQKTPSPFNILVNSTQISPDDVVNVTIRSTGRRTFRGFFLQILPLSSSTEKGTIFPQSRFLPGEQTTVASCVNAGDSVLHADESLKETISFLWKASSFISGPLQIRGSIFEDEDTYWENVLSEPISVITDPGQEDKSKNTAQATQVETLNNNQAETTPPSSVTSNPFNIDKSIRNDVYTRETTFNTVLYTTTAPTEKTTVGQDKGASLWNSVQIKKPIQDESTKSVSLNSTFSFDDLLSREGIQRIEGSIGNTVADHTFSQGFPTVNNSQKIDSVGPLGKYIAPPETSEVLATALKSIMGAAGGGGLGTVFKVATTLGRRRTFMGKRNSPRASNLNAYSGMMGGGLPMGGLGGLGGQNSFMDLQSNPLALQQQVQSLQQQLALQNYLLAQTNPLLTQSQDLQGLQNQQLGLQNSQLALQNQLGLQTPLLGAQNPFGLQNSQFGLQNLQLGLGMQGQTNPFLGQNQFGMGGLQVGNLPQHNRFGQFIPSQGTGHQLNSQWNNPVGGNQFGGSAGTGSDGPFGGISSGGSGSLFGQSSGGAGGGSPSDMLGGLLVSSIPAGAGAGTGDSGGSAGIGAGLFGHGARELGGGLGGLGGAGLGGGAGGLGGMLSGLMSGGGRGGGGGGGAMGGLFSSLMSGGGGGAGGLGSLLGGVSPDQLNSVTSLLSGPQGDVLQKSVFDLLNGENGGAIQNSINGILAGDMSAMGNLQSMLSGSAGDSIRKAVKSSLKP